MKANEFIRKNGIEASKKILSFRSGFRGFITLTDGSALHSDELRELVESHELVESLGGLDKAKMYLGIAIQNKSGNVKCKNFLVVHKSMLKQAIADVESCGGERG